MGIEIERKFLTNNSVKQFCIPEYKLCDITQGYLTNSDLGCVRIRLTSDTAFLTVKSSNVGIERDEDEIEIPYNIGKLMLATIDPATIIYKTRYYHGSLEGQYWTIDVFKNQLSGLILAEIELKYPEEQVLLPLFISNEVTDDPRFYNKNLIHCSTWIPSIY